MPLTYLVDSNYERSKRPKRKLPDKTSPILPSAKPPEAVTVVPPAPRYSVIPQEVPQVQIEEPPPGLTSQPVYDETNAPSTTAPVQQDPYGLQEALAALRAARNRPVEKTSRLKAFGKMAAYGLSQVKPGKEWSDVAMQAGSALGGGFAGAVQPKLPGAVRKLYDVQKAEEDVGTAQKIASAGALANYRTESLDIRRDKMEMDQAYREWQKKDKTRLTDNTINRTKFLQDYMRHKEVTTDTQNAFMNAYREKTLLERMRQFNANDEIKRAQLMVNQARQKTYEESVRNGATTAQARIIADAAEGQALLDAADDYDDLLEGLDPTDDYDQILQIKRDQRRARREGQAKIAAARAAGEVRGTPSPNTMPTTTAPSEPVRRPKNDPEGLFKP